MIEQPPSQPLAGSAAWQALHPRTVALWRLQMALRGLLAVVVTGGATFVLHNADTIDALTAIVATLGVAIAMAAVLVVWPPLAYKHWRYRLATDALELERGVFTRRRSVVPYGRVQQVDLTRGPIDRSLGLTAARLLTASSSTDGSVPGLSPDDAEAFRRLVLQRAGRDDAV